MIAASINVHGRNIHERADEHEHRGQSHRHAIGSRGRGGKGRTHTQQENEGGVLLDDAVFDDIQIVHDVFFFLER